jgi:hypothetical protein
MAMIISSDVPLELTIPTRLHNIGVGGRINHGKDICGLYLSTVYGYKVVKFATALREKAIGVLMEQQKMTYDEAFFELTDRRKKDKWRVLSQNVGMSEREADPDHWIKRSGIREARGLNVVTDARFENELDAIERKPGITVFVRSRWRESDIDLNGHLNHVSEALGPESFMFTATVPRGVCEATYYWKRFWCNLGLPEPSQESLEEFAILFQQEIERAERQ